MLAGALGDPEVERVLDALGAEVSDGKLRVFGRVLPARGVRVEARFGASRHADIPSQVTLWSGVNPVLRVRLNRHGKPRPETFVDLAPERVVHPERYLRAELEDGWRVFVHRDVSAAHLDSYVQALVRAESRLLRLLPASSLEPARDLIVEAWASELTTPGQGLQSWARATTGAAPLVVWLEPGREDRAGLHDAGALHAQREALRRLGPASLAWMPRALGIEASDSYGGMALEEWVAGGRGWPGTLQELLQAEAGGYSPHELDPARALLLRVALERNAESVLHTWRGESALDWTRLEASWRARMVPRAERGPRELTVRPTCIGVLAEAPLTERGGNLGSAQAAARLEQLQSGGFDCVGLVVHLSGPQQAGQAWRAVEGDAAAVAWLRRARAMGLLTTLVLEHWLAPSNIPAGDRVMGTAAEVSSFFERHSQAAAHAACLARMAGVDLLCLGMGQGESLRTRDVQAGASSAVMQAREAGWARVLDAAGGAFAGALTVARNGARQAQEFGPGESLNACAISLYGDLSSKDQRMPADARLLEQRALKTLERCSQLALTLEQPLVILPLAAAPTSLASRGRLSGPGEHSVGEQDRVLRAWGRALAELERSARPPAATFLWRWPALGEGPGQGGYACSLEGARALLDARR